MKEINIGRVLIKNRHKRGITQDELANHLGVSKGAVSKWETGTSLQETCQRKNGQDRPALYHGKSGEKIQEYPSSDGGFVKHKKLMVSGKKPVNL